MKKRFGTFLMFVIALGTLALVLPTPEAGACKNCRAIACPPCYQLGGGSCNKCPTCQQIPGCTP
ncbi:MAG TPA: hypothetical protein VFV19_16640 [Candidatus Polarisedimenticolaceae bacterium]|nr:hypothetical protein [Candidatus Polarisedimenticolaceae bacterium]